MRLRDLITEDQLISCDIEDTRDFNALSNDPQKCDDNTLLAIPNSKKIPTLNINNTVKYVLCGEDTALPPGIKSARVKKPRESIAYAYSKLYSPNLSKAKIIGVSGTNGKTTTAELIKTGLESEGLRVGYIGTGKISVGEQLLSDNNYSMTTPDPWLLYPTIGRMMEMKCDYIVMEVSSHSIALGKVAPIQFEYAVFTNLSREHMDFHKDMEDYYNTKKVLYEKARCSVINIDDRYGRRLVKEISGKHLSVGVLWRGDVWASGIASEPLKGTRFFYHDNGFCCKININFPGLYNVYNCLLAMAVCTKAGIKPCNVKNSIAKFDGVLGRYNVIKDKITVIIDYAHTPLAFEYVLKDISSSKSSKNNLFTVFGCGGERDKEKRPEMARIAESYSDKVIVTSDNSRNEDPERIISDIVSGFRYKKHIICLDRYTAIISAITEAKNGDIVAIIGKGPEKYNIDKEGYHSFDEYEIVSEALRIRNDC